MMEQNGKMEKRGFFAKIFGATEDNLPNADISQEEDSVQMAPQQVDDIVPEPDEDIDAAIDAADDDVAIDIIDEEDDPIIDEHRASLLAEEEAKLREAEQAIQAAAAAEDAREQAEYDYVINQAQEAVMKLNERLALLHEEAIAALAKLSAAEKEYKDALTIAATASQEERDIREQAEKEISYIVENNKSALSVANENLQRLAATLEANRADYAAALAECKQAEQSLEEAKQTFRQISDEKQQALKDAKQKAELGHSEIDNLKNDITAQNVFFETKIKTLEEEFDLAQKALRKVEGQHRQCHDKLDKLSVDDKQFRDNLNAELESVVESFEGKIHDAKTERDQVEFAIKNSTDDEAQYAHMAEELRKESFAIQAEIKRLKEDRAALIKSADKEIAKNKSKIDAAHKAVADKKDEYAKAQLRVEELTTISVQANAAASAARAKANIAALEKADASTAAEMAKKLKSDASTARESTDQDSSILLSKAEMVLMNTSEQAVRLLEEKEAYYQLTTQEVERLQGEADIATAEAKRAAATADKLITDWVTAEESLAKTTTAINAIIKDIENNRDSAIYKLDEKIAALPGQKDAKENEFREATQKRKDASAALSQYQSRLEELNQILDMLSAQYAAAKAGIEDSLKKHAYEVETTQLEYQTELDRLHEEKDKLQADLEEKNAALSDKHEEYSAKYEEQQQALRSKMEQVDLLDTNALQAAAENEKTATEIKARSDEMNAYLLSCQKRVEELKVEVSKIEETYESAIAEAEKVKLAGDAALANAQNAADEALTPKRQFIKEAEDEALLCYEQLIAMRQTTETVLKKAVSLAIERVKAVSKVEVKNIEVALYNIDKEIESIKPLSEASDLAFVEVEEEYNRQLAQINALREEEAAIVADTDMRYQEIEAGKQEELAAIDEEIAKLEVAEKEMLSTIEESQQQVHKLEMQLDSKKNELEALVSADMQLVEEQKEKLHILEQKYDSDVEAEGEQLTSLYAKYKDISGKLEEANALLVEAEKQVAEQQEAVIKLTAEENETIEEYGKATAGQKDNSKSALLAIQKRIADLNARRQALVDEKAKTDISISKISSAQKETEDLLQRLAAEEDDTKASYDSKIAVIEDRLQLLKEDAALKEQKFLASEATLKNGNQLLVDAETAVADATDNYERAASAVSAAEATYKTSQVLAEQASHVFQTGDNDMHMIMRRAAEDLLQAADNASALLDEKKKAFADAEKQLRLSKLNYDKMQNSIKEAPALTEESKDIWTKALDEYNQYREIADNQLPEIKRSRNAFIREQDKAIKKASAELEQHIANLQQAVEQKAAIDEELTAIAAELAAKDAELRGDETKAAEQLASLESSYQALIEEKKQTRLAAETELSQLEEKVLQLKEEQEEILLLFEQIKASYNNSNEAFLLSKERLHEQYRSESEEIEATISSSRAVLDEAREEIDQLMQEKKAAGKALSTAKVEYQKLVTSREKILAEKENVIVHRERMLNEAAEEKLKVMGYKTIARIAAEERVNELKSEVFAKQTDLAAIKGQIEDLMKQREQISIILEEAKLAGEKALSEAKANMVDLLRKAV